MMLSRRLIRCVSAKPVVLLRNNSKLCRIPIRVYDPKEGEVRPKQSLAKIPEWTVDSYNNQLDKVKSSGELFGSLMGNILTTKNKSMIAVEGGRLVEEALTFGLKLNYLFLLRSLKTYPDAIRNIVENQPSEQESTYHDFTNHKKVGPEVHKISLTVLQNWSALETPPGIIGIFDKPTELVKKSLYEKCCKNTNKVPLTVVLDNIRDPGNLGSIMRSAAGIGCKLLLSKGCVDPWDMKALRGGNGAQFLIPMRTGMDMGLFHQYIDLTDLFQTIEAGSEDVNAGHEMQEVKNSGIGIFLADSGVGEDSFRLPIVPYTSLDYSSFKSIYLIIGGETSGLSKTVKHAIASLKNIYPEEIKTVTRINIPMQLPIDSLNVANAFGVIGYEIARQFSKR